MLKERTRPRNPGESRAALHALVAGLQIFGHRPLDS